MGKGLRALRRRILTPNVSETSLDVRGFHKKNPEAQELLENVGKMFLTGYAHAVEARSVVEAEEWLEEVPAPFRGFAYEGAGMGYAMLDGLPFGHSHHVADCLAGRGDEHVYMVYVGIGWAMARLPRFRWPSADDFDPLLRGLILDGYGFHQAYFHTERYVYQQYQDPAFPWPGDATREYSHHAIDQGIGRAMWFVGGTDAALVASMIDRFPESRRADLYAGTGLAATYAGGVEQEELHVLRDRAGTWRPQLAQASAFAAEARVRAGLLVPHTPVATGVLCGTTPELAAELTRRVRPDAPAAGGEPAYEVWRRRVAGEFVSIGGVNT
ncbi:enediyne biosynthesis protein [Amycolatopsis antarctica]|uniref:Enediyne biosynthesis protein n=1 Tax=Amycolatopsis antarctica TaxID=1854586 RepID=A0A263D385_9PSEU|nr:DUF1702 family protein [Amycolatopsis antarctica]OZM71926.1 enediyne biosynthesis protein [Amycolatopsis antarctica]